MNWVEGPPSQHNGDQAQPAVGSVGAPEQPGKARPEPLVAGGGQSEHSVVGAASSWLRGSRLGLAVMALVVGVGAGFGAVGFRWLIFGITWLATGHQQFGQQGRVGSLHLPWLGIWFLVVIPVVGGLIYGPIVQRFAREARGHGVPEVMLAVSENGGRIRPQVSVVKAVASAMCIGTGGSVGREGPIVQIGSAFASTLGQVVRMSDTRLRVIVACGAAGGIAATFNAPLTGLFFGFEIILREFSLDALFATALSAVTADLVSRAFFGSAPFFASIPHDMSITHDDTYLLVVVLGLCAGLLGYGFKTVLYKFEDRADVLWKGRPEWARPAVGGIALGLLLLALPQMYGVGYPVMGQAVAGRIVLWLLLVLMVGKMVAASLTLSIGGSGGVFAPSLFIGAMAGMAFGVVVQHVFGPVGGDPAIFAVVAMAGVFGAAAQAPLTAIASVVEMTGNFTLILPVMLATGIAAALSKRLSHGSIYTTKLLRRGIDIERPKPTNVLQLLTVADVMQPVSQIDGLADLGKRDGHTKPSAVGNETWAELVGPVTDIREPQALLDNETLDQALRQLALYGRLGLPVLSEDRHHLRGWVTRHDVLRVMAARFSSSAKEAEQGALASEFAVNNARDRVQVPSNPLEGYKTVEITMRPGAVGLGKRIGEIPWPPDSVLVLATEGREVVRPRSDTPLRLGERVVLLAPAGSPDAQGERTTETPEKPDTTAHPTRVVPPIP
jgi:chloride channel protein, CIC family